MMSDDDELQYLALDRERETGGEQRHGRALASESQALGARARLPQTGRPTSESRGGLRRTARDRAPSRSTRRPVVG